MNGVFLGVRPASESSIEIGFMYQGQHHVKRLRWRPTANNLRQACTLHAAMTQAIARNAFDEAMALFDGATMQRLNKRLGPR